MTLQRELELVFWGVRSRRRKMGRSLVIVDGEVDVIKVEDERISVLEGGGRPDNARQYLGRIL